MPVIRDIQLSLKTAEVNPGMPGFPLTDQCNLLRLANADRIGARLTASGVLVPRDLHGYRHRSANDKVDTG